MSAWAAMRYVRDELPNLVTVVDGKDKPLVDTVALHVAMIIATHTNKHTGFAHVGIRTLAHKCRMNHTTVERAIRRLEAWGVLMAVRQVNGLRSKYQFPAANLSTTVLPDSTVPNDNTARPGSTDRATEPRALASKRQDLYEDPRGLFLPGTGWVRTS
jgi:hypothetical protein